MASGYSLDLDQYRIGQHRTAVYEHLTSQAGVYLINCLPQPLKNATTPKALKHRLKGSLASQEF